MYRKIFNDWPLHLTLVFIAAAVCVYYLYVHSVLLPVLAVQSVCAPSPGLCSVWYLDPGHGASQEGQRKFRSFFLQEFIKLMLYTNVMALIQSFDRFISVVSQIFANVS